MKEHFGVNRITPVTRSLTPFEQTGGAMSCSCDSQLTNRTIYPINLIDRSRLGGRNDGVDFHPLQRGGKVFLASRVSLENLEGVTTYSRIPNSCAHLEYI